MLIKYLPQYTVGNLPVLRQSVSNEDQQRSNPLLDNERKVIYEAILKMQKELKELREIVNGLMAGKDNTVIETMPH